MPEVTIDLYEYSSDGNAQTAYVSNAKSFSSQYPTSHNDTYVKATSKYSTNYWPYYATNPAKSLTGGMSTNSWYSSGPYNQAAINQRFHIDLGSAIRVNRIYYENFHNSGGSTGDGIKDFTLWGSNSSSDFSDLTYANDGTWVQLTTSQSTFDQHTGSNVVDPKYITVTNTTEYRYYAIKIQSAWTGGASGYVGVRRIELQSGLPLEVYSEATIKEEGSYSLKSVAKKTQALNKRIVKTFASPIDLTGLNYITLSNRSNRTGTNLKATFKNSSDAYTGLLLHCQNYDSSTTFTDETGKAITANGNAKHSTTSPKFGISSAYFDGTGDSLTTPNHANFSFGTGDFTIDFWFKTSQTGRQYATFLSTEAVGSGYTILFNKTSSSAGDIAVWGGLVSGLTTSTTGYNDGNWHHLAYVRYGTSVKIYVDGVSRASATISASLTENCSAQLVIGNNTVFTPRDYNGYISEFRITKGLARWTGDFTVPSAPYDIIESNIVITDADTWEKTEIDISTVADADKDSIKSLEFTITNSDSDNTLYFDNAFAYDTLTYEGSETINISEDIELNVSLEKVELSDGIEVAEGCTFTQTLTKEASDSIELSETIELNVSLERIYQNESNITISEESEIVLYDLYDFYNDFRIVSEATVDVPSYIAIIDWSLTSIGCVITLAKNVISDFTNKFNMMREEIKDLTCKLNTVSSWQRITSSGPQSLGKDYIYTYLNGVLITDVDIDSENINKVINGEHTATFDLCRAYDATRPDLESEIKIYYKDYLLFKGYITSIAPTDSTEKIQINCKDEYWYLNRTESEFSLGHAPKDKPYNEVYYATINTALSTKLNFSTDIGEFIPDRTSVRGGQSDAITQLITNCGNYGWYIDVDGTKKIVAQGSGDIKYLNRQTLGRNIHLYDVLEHSITENIEGLVNQYLVHTGDTTIAKYNKDLSPNTKGYTDVPEDAEYDSTSIDIPLVPDWNLTKQKTAIGAGTQYGFDNPSPNETGWDDVCRRYKFADNPLTNYKDEDYTQTNTDNFIYSGANEFQLSHRVVKPISIQINGIGRLSSDYIISYGNLSFAPGVTLSTNDKITATYNYVEFEWEETKEPQLFIEPKSGANWIPNLEGLHYNSDGSLESGFTVDLKNETVILSQAIYERKYRNYINTAWTYEGTSVSKAVNPTGESRYSTVPEPSTPRIINMWDSVSPPTLTLRMFIKKQKTKYTVYNFNDVPDLPDNIEQPTDDWTYSNYFKTPKYGTYSSTIRKMLELNNYSYQVGYRLYNSDLRQIDYVPSWNDIPYAYDLACWQLSKVCNSKIRGTIKITLDALCYYNIKLEDRIMIDGMLTEPVNINSISYNFRDFTASIEIESYYPYKRTKSLPYHGD